MRTSQTVALHSVTKGSVPHSVQIQLGVKRFGNLESRIAIMALYFYGRVEIAPLRS